MQKLIIKNQLTSYTQDNDQKLPLYAGWLTWFITLDLKENNNLKVACIAEHLCQNAAIICYFIHKTDTGILS